MHDAESAIEVIRARDASAATVAHALWVSLRMSASHPTQITRYDVQQIIWDAVPDVLRRPDGAKTFPDRHAVREVLAELLDLLDYPRYAELCRGETTRAILDAADNEELCERLSAKAWRESGVKPPNTPIFTWSEPCGPVEEALHSAAGRLLEEAIDKGMITLGQPDTEDQRIALTMRLMISQDNDGADTWFVKLVDERLDSWIHGGGSQTRRELLVRVRPEIRQTPDVSDAGLPALQRLLEVCDGRGARLTGRGYMPTSLVYDLVEIMPTCRELMASGRSESSWPPIRALRELATDFGLVHKERGRLRLTPLGHKLVDDPDSLLMTVGEAVVTFERVGLGVLQEVVLAALLLEDLVEPDRLFEKVAYAFQEGGWTDRDGGPFGLVHADAVGSWFLRRLRVLDAAHVDWSTERIGLTEAGRSIARWALRGRVLYRRVDG